MTAVCRGDKAEDEKHSGIQHSVSCSSHRCEGQDTESWMLDGNPCQECVGKADKQACPPFQCTLVFRACCPCFPLSHCLCCPFDTAVHLALNTFCFPFLFCSCLSIDVFYFIFFSFVELFKFLQFPHGRRLRRWCCPFLPSHTLGRASENEMAADWREESEANTCLKAFGQTLPLGSLLQLPLLKWHPSMTAVGYEV